MKFKTVLLTALLVSPAWAAQSFTSPEAAGDALLQAVASADRAAIVKVLGTEAKDLVDSGDGVADSQAAQTFSQSYAEQHRWRVQGQQQVLEIGSSAWPFPIPLVQSKGQWQFDSKAGRRELLQRRIGLNELSAIQSVQAYVDAQREYYALDPENKGLLQYAQRINSLVGKKDGLFWPTAADQSSPLGELFAKASREGYDLSDEAVPYHGYYFRALSAQGQRAKGGAYSYLANGAQIGGFALIAYPAKYGVSGVTSFIVNHDGVVYERDLGRDTQKRAQSMSAFNPNSNWKAIR